MYELRHGKLGIMPISLNILSLRIKQFQFKIYKHACLNFSVNWLNITI